MSDATAAWAYLAGALVGLWFTVQAVRPVPLPKVLAIPSFFAGWLTNELAFHHLAWQAVATALWLALGALGHAAGWVALALTVAQWVALVHLIRLAARVGQVTEEAVRQVCGGPPTFDGDDPQLAWRRLVVPRPRHPDVRVRRDVPYGRAGGWDLRLDVHAHRDPDRRRPAPCLLYVHGGAWTLGFRDRQGLPLLSELASRGWVCVSVGYRLSPLATWPDHAVDVKRGLAWIRKHADELGVDPGFVAVAGNSAGAHLAAVVALTAGDVALQPGFEHADTSIQAAVPVYGVYDLHDRLGLQPERFDEFVTRYLVKADPDEAPERWRTISPLELVHPGAPPFLVVHGTRDSLTPLGAAEAFVDRLREVSRSPVALAAIPGAQHAFDVFPSLRTARLVHGVVRFLEHTYAAGGRGCGG